MKFSVITPSLNQGKWVNDCLQSVKLSVAGCSLSVEHLVVDGASKDTTVGILETWKREHPNEANYTFDFISEPDRGQTQAINKGLARSSGDILSYLCSDDLLEPGALAAVGKFFQEHPEVEVIYGDYYFLEGDSGWKRLKKAQAFTLEGLRRHNFISQPATFWRRSVYEKFGGFDEDLRYCMDHEYWLRIADGVRWFYLEQPLAVMRLHGEAKTSAALGAAWEETYCMVGRYGLADHFRNKALWMNWGGQWHYWLKRKVAEWLGKRRASK